MIDFNVPIYLEDTLKYIEDACKKQNKICGDGGYTQIVSKWFEDRLKAKKVLLTTSCSHALDMMFLLADIKEGDEVIIPSYNFVSGANSVAMRGGKCVFVDIRKDTMNIDEGIIEEAITPNTKAILVVHYAGVACNMEKIGQIAKKHNLFMFEDAAQGMMSTYKNKPLGTIGDLGAFSFHETKNYTMGEGGLLIINEDKFIEKAEILREKGTDRSKFWRGQVDKYTWQSIGSSYLPSEINVAYLYPQLKIAEEINKDRLDNYNIYYDALKTAAEEGKIELPYVPCDCTHNGHMFFIKLKDIKQRTAFIEYMKKRDIICVFHYVPLHSSPAGKKYGIFFKEDKYTTKESERLVRLPMYYGLKAKQTKEVANCVLEFLTECE